MPSLPWDIIVLGAVMYTLLSLLLSIVLGKFIARGME
jgi:hypothetical protein